MACGQFIRARFCEELDALGMSAYELANVLAVPPNASRDPERFADTALRLARYFGTTPQLWLNLQTTFNLRVAETEAGGNIDNQVQPRQAAPTTPTLIRLRCVKVGYRREVAACLTKETISR